MDGKKRKRRELHPGQEYLSVNQVADRLGFEPKTIRNKVSAGVFRLGIHYFQPARFQLMFKWSAVVELIEGREAAGLSLDPRISFVSDKNGGTKYARGLHS